MGEGSIVRDCIEEKDHCSTNFKLYNFHIYNILHMSQHLHKLIGGVTSSGLSKSLSKIFRLHVSLFIVLFHANANIRIQWV